MADPVKISELPAISSVQANDIVPIVDAALTQTSKATAAQIAAIGGGPPGDGTVTTAKLANGAATAAKSGFTGPDKIISRTNAGAGEGVEIPCTAWARGLLASTTNNEAVSYISNLLTFASATFSGVATFTGRLLAAAGTAASPAYSFTSDSTSGMSQLAGAGSVSLVAGGSEAVRITSDGTTLTKAVGTSTFLPQFACRAWVKFSAGGGVVSVSGSANISSVQRVSTGIYYINFLTPMPDANYIAHHSGHTTVVTSTLGNTVSAPGVLVHAMASVAYPDSTYTANRVAVGVFEPFSSAVRGDTSLSLVSIFR